MYTLYIVYCTARPAFLFPSPGTPGSSIQSVPPICQYSLIAYQSIRFYFLPFLLKWELGPVEIEDMLGMVDITFPFVLFFFFKKKILILSWVQENYDL